MDTETLAETKKGVIVEESDFLKERSTVSPHITSHFIPWFNRLWRVVFPGG
jgi:hypothetical protein